MKIRIEKNSFLKSWNLAERSAGSGSSMNIFSTIRLKADESRIELQATDIKTSVICEAKGVTVLEPGEAVIPLKGVGDLFKKAGSSEFTLQIEDGRATMMSGKSRYRFTTYPVSDFPKLPSAEGGELFCELPVSALSVCLERGTLCASVNDEYPQYLSSAYFHIEDGEMKIVSTDNRRLSVSSAPVFNPKDGASLLLPMKGIKEFQRVLSMLDPSTLMKIMFDDAQAYFSAEDMEFAVRRVESKFPLYKKILPTNENTFASIDRASLIAALERVDVVVRDYNRVVVVRLSPGGDCTLSGKAPEFGEAVEDLNAEIDGESLRIGINTRFFHDALKVLDDAVVRLSFNGPEGHMCVRAKNSDSFVCLIAPMGLDDGDDGYVEDEPTGFEASNPAAPADDEI